MKVEIAIYYKLLNRLLIYEVYMDTNKKLYCACCGKEIGDTTYDVTSERGYYKVLDNYLQVNYFDSEEDNIFCSEECVLKSLSVEFIYLEDEEVM